MKYYFRKTIFIVLTASFMIFAAMPAMAYFQEEEKVAYAIPEGQEITIEIRYDKEKIQKVKKTDVSVSNKSVVKPVSIYNWEKEDDFVNIRSHDFDKIRSLIYLKTVKSGKAVVRVKNGSKTYNTKIRVYKYVNPLKSLTITGVNNGKSVHSKFNKATKVSGSIQKNVSNGTVTAKEKDGWDITELHVYDYAAKKKYLAYTANKTTSIRNLKIRKGSKLVLEIVCENRDNKANMTLRYTLK